MKWFPLIVILISMLGNAESNLQFELEVNRFKCYIEELFKGSVLMVKYKVEGLVEPDEQKANMFLSMINLSLIGESDQHLFKREPFKKEKGKFSFTSLVDMTYKICVTYHGGWTVPYPVLVSLKISSDNMDELKIEDAIKITDTDPMHNKVRNIMAEGRNLVERQRLEKDDEENVAFDMMRHSKSFYHIAVFQIIIILSLGVYQVYRFRKFLGGLELI